MYDKDELLDKKSEEIKEQKKDIQERDIEIEKLKNIIMDMERFRMKNDELLEVIK